MIHSAPIQMHLARSGRLVIAAALVALAAACTPPTPPPHLYVLTPLLATPIGERNTSGLTTIVVAQAQVPDYLDRPQLIERTSDNELKLVETDQWAERLSLNVSRVVALNLSTMVPADANVAVPVRASLPYDYQVLLSLNSFELDLSQEAVLGGRWAVTNADGTKELAAAGVSLREKASRPGIAAAVEAMNRNLGAVSKEIAVAIKRLVAQGGAK